MIAQGTGGTWRKTMDDGGSISVQMVVLVALLFGIIGGFIAGYFTGLDKRG